MITKVVTKIFSKGAKKESKAAKAKAAKAKAAKAAKKAASKKKTVTGGLQKLAGKALINPITLGGGAAYGVGRASGRSSEKQKVNQLNEALRRRGVRV